MPLPPITVEMTKFVQIEILRQEIDATTEQLKQTEVQIRDILYEQNKQQYLLSMHPYFRKIPPPETAKLAQLNAERNQMGEAIDKMTAALSALEAETGTESAPRGQLSAMRNAGAPPARAPGGVPSSGLRPKNKFEF